MTWLSALRVVASKEFNGFYGFLQVMLFLAGASLFPAYFVDVAFSRSYPTQSVLLIFALHGLAGHFFVAPLVRWVSLVP